MTAPAFYADAACRGIDTWFFFPWSAQSRPSPLAVMACSRCGVREECLSFSITHPIQQGYWGGMTEEQRLAERKRRHIQQATDRRRAVRASQQEQQREEATAA